jgi:hypothetical protein
VVWGGGAAGQGGHQCGGAMLLGLAWKTAHRNGSSTVETIGVERGTSARPLEGLLTSMVECAGTTAWRRSSGRRQ